MNRVGPPPVTRSHHGPPRFPSSSRPSSSRRIKYKITDANFAQSPLGANVSEDLRPFVIGKVIAGIPLQVTDPTYDLSSVPPHTSLGIHTQVTASPLLVGNAKSTNQSVFFTVFDPDWGCNGYSYVIKIEFTIDVTSHEPTFGATTVYAAGPGAASGFVATDKGAVTAQSGVAKNEATVVKVDIPKPALPGATTFRPVWWKEQR